MTFESIIKDLKNKVFHPVYFLYGEEPYYIDKISDYIEENVLSENEKEFNQSVIYGKDTDLSSIVSYSKRFPMMSNYKVIIVKEAQEIKGFFSKERKEAFSISSEANTLKAKICIRSLKRSL